MGVLVMCSVRLWCLINYVSMVSEKCYSGPKVVLQWCYCGVTVVLQWCSNGVTVMSEDGCAGHVPGAALVLNHLQWCDSGMAVVLQWCYSGVTVVLLLCCSGGCHNSLTVMLQ
jgi:hypothetical protein